MRPESRKPFLLGLGVGLLLGVTLCVAGVLGYAVVMMRAMERADVSSLPPVAVPEGGEVRFGAVTSPFRLVALAGDTLTLKPPYERALLLNVWGTWCVPCRREMPSLEALADSLRGNDISFYCVSKEPPEILRSYLEENPSHLPIYHLVGFLPEALSAPAIPSTFVLDREGGVRLQHRGATNWDDARVLRFLRKLSEQAPTER